MLLWLIYILSEAVIQFKLIEEFNQKPNYLSLFFIRGIFALFLAFPILYCDSLEAFLILLGFQTTSFWVFFDLILNKLRNKPWNYKGKTSGWLDSLDSDIYFKLKFLALIAMIVFYIIGLQYFPF